MASPIDSKETPAKPSNFLRQVIDRDLADGTYAQRQWGGTPGDAAHHHAGPLDPARIRTRFPPEPNGYLHVGHAKSICLNFGLARDYGGVCHMRFDDTNPEKEEQEYVDSILDSVKWLGFGWQSNFNGVKQDHLYYASNYFDFMYRAAESLIGAGLAYVDEQTPEEMRGPVTQMTDEVLNWLTGILEEGRKDGSFVFARSADDLAALIASGLQGAVQLSRATKRPCFGAVVRGIKDALGLPPERAA